MRLAGAVEGLSATVYARGVVTEVELRMGGECVAGRLVGAGEARWVLPPAPRLPAAGRVVVTAAGAGPGEVALQVAEAGTAERLGALTQRLAELYGGGGGGGGGHCAPPGHLVVARYTADEQWYRAIVVRAAGDGGAATTRVRFVDFGNEEEVAEVAAVAGAELVRWPAFALSCRLARVGGVAEGVAWPPPALPVGVALDMTCDGDATVELSRNGVSVSTALLQAAAVVGVEVCVPAVTPVVVPPPPPAVTPAPPPAPLAAALRRITLETDGRQLMAHVCETTAHTGGVVVQLLEGDHLVQLAALTERLLALTPDPGHAPVLGELVCARAPDDPSWCRAEVTAVGGGAKYEVRFVDFGNEATVTAADVARADAGLLEYPAFGVVCRLTAATRTAPRAWQPVYLRVVGELEGGVYEVELSETADAAAGQGGEAGRQDGQVDGQAVRAPDGQVDGQLANQMAGLSTDQLVDQPADQATGQLANQSADQSGGQSTDQRANQSADQTANQSADQTANQSADQTTTQSADQTANQSADQTANQSADQTANQSADQTATQSAVPPAAPTVTALGRVRLPAVGESVSGRVTHAPAPDRLTLQLLAGEPLTGLAALTAALAETYAGHAGSYTPRGVGELLAARFSEDGCWYRAEAMEVAADGATTVRFIDFGNSEVAPPGGMAAIAPPLLAYPLLGVGARLAGVGETIGAWDPALLRPFAPLTVAVVDDGDSVVLTDGDVCLNKQLIDSGVVRQAAVALPASPPLTSGVTVVVTDVTPAGEMMLQVADAPTAETLAAVEAAMVAAMEGYAASYAPRQGELVCAKYRYVIGRRSATSLWLTRLWSLKPNQ